MTTVSASSSVVRAGMLIDGEWVASCAGETIEIRSPATRALIGSVPRGNSVDVERAVAAASRAYPAWRATSIRDRSRLMREIASALSTISEDLARMLATETGNAIRTAARPEAMAAADIFNYYAGIAGEAKGETVPSESNLLTYTTREPYGVVGAIIPWNAPIVAASVKVASAICVGNTVVLKPAEDAPLTVLMLAEVWNRVLPRGVVNVITGLGAEAGQAIASHPAVRKVSFTGSTAVGRSILHAAADKIAPTSLELGGKSPSIVFPSANNAWAVDGVLAAMRFTRQSQSCTAGSRLFVHDAIYDTFTDLLATRLQDLKVGDPLDESSDMGTLINQRQFDRVDTYVREGIEKFPTSLRCGGLRPNEGPLATGYYAIPTLFTDASNEWRLAREEIFGPVLVAIRWREQSDMLKMANDTHYGLAAFIWTTEMREALMCARALEAGWIQVNQGAAPGIGQSFGGVKQSGFGREFSLEGMLDSFTQRKCVTLSMTAGG